MKTSCDSPGDSPGHHPPKPSSGAFGGLRVAFALCLFGCNPYIPYEFKSEPDPRKTEFVIGTVDLLRITVWKNAELSTDARVRPDGTITMPLIGDVKAAGRTPSALNKTISHLLAAYLNEENRHVTVAVVEVNSYRFTVSGNVERPGVWNPRNYVTVVEAVALAGGLNRFANEHRLVLLRGDPVRRIPIDYSRIVAGDHPEENLALLAGDTLSVP